MITGLVFGKEHRNMSLYLIFFPIKRGIHGGEKDLNSR